LNVSSSRKGKEEILEGRKLQKEKNDFNQNNLGGSGAALYCFEALLL
jgi:hypothetical protein